MSQISEQRAMKDEMFRDDPDSPLTAEQQNAFEGLKYYPEDPAYDVIATLEMLDEMEPLTMITSKGTAQDFYRIGHLHFTIDDTPQKLALFQDEEGQYLFLPFADATTGDQTYGAGRYVEVAGAGLKDGRQLVRIDFNQAYNPYCAYNENWVCPIPPVENTLTVPIRAGEKRYHEEGAEQEE